MVENQSSRAELKKPVRGEEEALTRPRSLSKPLCTCISHKVQELSILMMKEATVSHCLDDTGKVQQPIPAFSAKFWSEVANLLETS